MSLAINTNNQIVMAVARIEKLQGNWWAWKRCITQQFKKLRYTWYLTENEPPQPADPESKSWLQPKRRKSKCSTDNNENYFGQQFPHIGRSRNDICSMESMISSQGDLDPWHHSQHSSHPAWHQSLWGTANGRTYCQSPEGCCRFMGTWWAICWQ